jgi:hypothetical protein
MRPDTYDNTMVVSPPDTYDNTMVVSPPDNTVNFWSCQGGLTTTSTTYVPVGVVTPPHPWVTVGHRPVGRRCPLHPTDTGGPSPDTPESKTPAAAA